MNPLMPTRVLKLIKIARAQRPLIGIASACTRVAQLTIQTPVKTRHPLFPCVVSAVTSTAT